MPGTCDSWRRPWYPGPEFTVTLLVNMQDSVHEDLDHRARSELYIPHVTGYSGHDSTLYALLHALNNELGEEVCPGRLLDLLRFVALAPVPYITCILNSYHQVWCADRLDAPRCLTRVLDFDAEVPPYASSVTIATWRDASADSKDGSEYCVELTFNGQTGFVPLKVFDAIVAQ